MIVRPNLKNILVFLLGSFFFYLFILIWYAEDPFPPIDVELRDIISYIILATEMGGSAISQIYSETSGGKIKIYDKLRMDVGLVEPLTRADLISNALMLELLRRFPLLTVISEEKSAKINDQDIGRYRADNYAFWLGLRELIYSLPTRRIPLSRIVIWIDPLDGTQEFTEGLTEFLTVMACITIDGKPFVGAIHSPFSNETIVGIVGSGVFSSKYGKLKENYHTNLKSRKVLISRSHAGNVSRLLESAFAGKDPPYSIEPAGGAGYKTLRLIQKTADLYVHTTAIKKWDICAGDAIAKAAGGALLSLSDGLPIDYSFKTGENNKKSDKIKSSIIHKDGILMSLDTPYAAYERLKRFLKFN